MAILIALSLPLVMWQLLLFNVITTCVLFALTLQSFVICYLPINMLHVYIIPKQVFMLWVGLWLEVPGSGGFSTQVMSSKQDRESLGQYILAFNE